MGKEVRTFRVIGQPLRPQIPKSIEEARQVFANGGNETAFREFVEWLRTRIDVRGEAAQQAAVTVTQAEGQGDTCGEGGEHETTKDEAKGHPNDA